MNVVDYLVMRTPPARMGVQQGATPGEVSGWRIAISIFGLLVGIFLSFIVTGLDAGTRQKAPADQKAPNGKVAPNPDGQPAPQAPPKKLEPQLTVDLSLQRILVVGLFTLVICGLTYQGLYFSLRLYNNEKAFLVFFVSFQYGYFWQSAVEGARIVFAGATGVGG